MRRISPVGGGAGSVLVILRNIPRPTFQIRRSSTRPNPTQTIVPNTGCWRDLEAFDDERVGQATTHTHRLQTVATTGALEFVEQRAGEACA